MQKALVVVAQVPITLPAFAAANGGHKKAGAAAPAKKRWKT
ncbi:hypothetical protein [Aeromonas molluscorum]|jgi:hypothetical protein|nr:hypothetical protein [Aeromonas molluscorum]